MPKINHNLSLSDVYQSRLDIIIEDMINADIERAYALRESAEEVENFTSQSTSTITCLQGREAHEFTEATSLDHAGSERICKFCGEVAPSEIDEPTKLSGCMDLESFLNVCYGPPTSIYLESFLVPTLRRIKCRDRYVDIKILAKLRTYTSILRVCSQYGIPKVYAEDTMRLLLKRKTGLYSKYAYIKVLMEVIGNEPRLQRRLKDLQKILPKKKRDIKKDEEEQEKIDSEQSFLF